MDEQKLFDFLEAAELKIQVNENAFFDYWNKYIIANLPTSSPFKIEDYISVFGGFKLPSSDFCQLDSSMQAFFSRRGRKDGDSIWLRGYSYYECDPQMHKKRERVNERTLWETFSGHWNGYSILPPISDRESRRLNVANWIGMLSFLEYVFNDLTTLLWFILSNEQAIKRFLNGHDFFTTVENAIDEIADLISGLLLFRFSEPFKEFQLKVNGVISNDDINKFVDISSKLSDFKPGCVRAVREGDSLPLIFSAYITKLLPFCKGTPQNQILFMSNAFGALNLGVLFKFLIRSQVSVEHINIQYSQHRADVAELGKESGTVKIYSSSPESQIQNMADSCVVVVDDCIFTGKSFSEIKKGFQDNNKVLLLPLTLDIQSLKYYKRETRDIQDTYKTANCAVLWAGELGNMLPAFQGFWDWSNVSEANTSENESEFDLIANGGDLLLKTLWSRYRQEIIEQASEKISKEV